MNNWHLDSDPVAAVKNIYTIFYVFVAGIPQGRVAWRLGRTYTAQYKGGKWCGDRRNTSSVKFKATAV